MKFNIKYMIRISKLYTIIYNSKTHVNSGTHRFSRVGARLYRWFVST